MRWGDSDSSDEDEIRVSSLPPRAASPPGDDREEDENRRHPGQRRSAPPPNTTRPRESHGGPRGGSGRGGRGRGSGRGPGPRGGPPRQDWREMAKSASRFRGSSEGASGPGQLDGSAWMAQRRKKMQEQEQETRRAQEDKSRQEEEQKRERRKSQFDALKAAVTEIESSSASSLQAAAAKAHSTTRPRQQSAPTRILTRPTVPEITPPPVQSKHEHIEDARSVQSSSTTSSSRGRKDGGRGRGRRDNERGSARHTGGREGGGRWSGRGDERSSTGGASTRVDVERDASKGRGESSYHSSQSGHTGRHHSDRGGRGRHGRGRGRGGGAARVHVGKTSVVRTASGNVEYHVSVEKKDDKTKGELLPNGTVRLSRKKSSPQHGGRSSKQTGRGGGRGHSSKSTSLQTKIEIGAEKK